MSRPYFNNAGQITYIERNTGRRRIETPPGEASLRFLYHHPLGRLPLHLLVKRKLLSSLYGRLMDRPGSRKKIVPFIQRYQIDMTESERPVEAFGSFNEFFARRLKPGARPIHEGLVSPADGKVLAFERPDRLGRFLVKGQSFTLAQFLRDRSLAERFGGGSLFLIRLAPTDYHRYHFPCDGVPSPAVDIRGCYYSVSPHAVARHFARVFLENKRQYCRLTSDRYGQVLICPVGATLVGRIVSTYTPDTPVQKGDEMGYFAFGGSSIILLTESPDLAIEPDLLANTAAGLETAVTMGQTLAR